MKIVLIILSVLMVVTMLSCSPRTEQKWAYKVTISGCGDDVDGVYYSDRVYVDDSCIVISRYSYHGVSKDEEIYVSSNKAVVRYYYDRISE